MLFRSSLKFNDRSSFGASLVAQRIKYLPAMQETWVWSLGWEDPLEKEMATHSSILAWRIPWTEEPGRLQSTGSQKVGHDWATSLSLINLKFLSILLVYQFTITEPTCSKYFLKWCYIWVNKMGRLSESFSHKKLTMPIAYPKLYKKQWPESN